MPKLVRAINKKTQSKQRTTNSKPEFTADDLSNAESQLKPYDQ